MPQLATAFSTAVFSLGFHPLVRPGDGNQWNQSDTGQRFSRDMLIHQMVQYRIVLDASGISQCLQPLLKPKLFAHVFDQFLVLFKKRSAFAAFYFDPATKHYSSINISGEGLGQENAYAKK